VTLMGAYGFGEAEVRAHSPVWANTQLSAILRRHRHELADLALVHTQATAAGMGSYESAGDELLELIEHLRADVDESSTAWITNPDAKTDLQALRESGRLTN
jgi:hypothetical protein